MSVATANGRVKTTIAAALGDAFRLRLTATVKLSGDEGLAFAQRDEIHRDFQAFARMIERTYGVAIEFVFGHPRSPDMLRAAIEDLARSSVPEADD